MVDWVAIPLVMERSGSGLDERGTAPASYSWNTMIGSKLGRASRLRGRETELIHRIPLALK